MIKHLAQLFLRRRSANRDRQLAVLSRAVDLRREIERRQGIFRGDPVAEARQQREDEMDRVLTRRLERVHDLQEPASP